LVNKADASDPVRSSRGTCSVNKRDRLLNIRNNALRK
jgi:hypothetical protein